MRKDIKDNLTSLQRRICCIENSNSYNSFKSSNTNYNPLLPTQGLALPTKSNLGDTLIGNYNDYTVYYTYNGTDWVVNWAIEKVSLPVSFSDIQDISTNKLLGRSTAGSGVIEQISIGTGLSLSGGTLTNTAPDQVITISGASGTYPNFTITPTSPAGSSGQIQFNNSGSFGADSNLFWDNANSNLTLGNSGTTLSARIGVKGSGSTSATTSFLVQNSSGTEAIKITDDGKVSINSINLGYSLNVGGNGIRTNNLTATSNCYFSAYNYIGPSNWGFAFADATAIYFGYQNTGIALRAGSTIQIYTTAAGTQIASNATNANARAQLDVVSTSKGFLPPRMTTAQRDAVSWITDDAGMVIYNTTTNKHQGWNGTTWNDFY